MNIDVSKMSEEQEALLLEFQNSGLSADEFLKKYFMGKGIEDPDQVVSEIDSTLAEIDRHYAAIKQAKADGKDRKAYLREVCDSVFTDKDAQKAGAALAAVANGLEGKEAAEKSLEYDGFEAASLISDLDNAVVNSTLSRLSGEEESNE